MAEQKEKRIPTREEVKEEFTWNLCDLFASDDDWKKEYELLGEVPAKLASFAGKLGESADSLLAFLKYSDEIKVRISVFAEYANCKSDQDTANAAWRDMRSKAMTVAVSADAASAFATPEILDIPDETLASFFAERPELETWRRPIEVIRRRKEHILSGTEEKLLAAAGEMSMGPYTICETFRDADIRYPDVTDSEGNPHQLTGESLVPLLTSPDRTLRQNAFESYYTRLGEFKNTVAASLDAHFRTLKFFSEARRYPSTLEASLDETEVPVEVYKNLITAVRGGLDAMYRYVRLRKRALGADELHMWDVYTPIVADADRKIGFEEAKKTVLEALSVLGDDYVGLLREGFENRWIDVYENVGKRGGAYSTGTSRPHPYVLLNHTDDLDSQFTLAHEMGHALHSWHSCKYQPVCTADYVIFVAEVASTCNEVLLMKHLLSKTKEPKERAYLINHFLDQFKGTVFRQTMFAEFELAMGEMIESGNALTADALCAKYSGLNSAYFGPAMSNDPGIALEWARIPHFFYNYYVFQYATGFCAAVAIANRILTEGKPAVEDYRKFLSSGSSRDPISLLKIAGVDMSTSGPVESALSLFGELVDELDGII
ncbi:MAG: oligoendopeptidase F [Clostridia bacterium]|nr:oligoendopeptidase F [Clostridia bacterium]